MSLTTSSNNIAPVNGQQTPSKTTTSASATFAESVEQEEKDNVNKIIDGKSNNNEMFRDDSKELKPLLASSSVMDEKPMTNDDQLIDNSNELNGNVHCNKDIVSDSGGGGGGGGPSLDSKVSFDKIDDNPSGLTSNDSNNSIIINKESENNNNNNKTIKNRKKNDNEQEVDDNDEDATTTTTNMVNADESSTSTANRIGPIDEKRTKRNCIRATESDIDGRYCWVCFATEEDDALAEWVQPCKCSGTTKWVHQTCLQRWVDEKQRGNSFKRVNCPQCQQEYIIVFPTMGTAFNILENVDAILKRISPFLAAGVIVGSLYWTAVTYGAITVLQVVGYREGLQIMEGCDPLLLLIGLPAIPVGLIAGRFLRWEDMILRFIHTHPFNARKFRPLQLLWPDSNENLNGSTNNSINLNYENNNNNNEENGATQIISSDPISATRVFCGALMLPTISAIIGKMFFESIQNNLHRTIVGGLSFVMVKGVLKIYFRQKQIVRKKQRKILDFTQENTRRFGNHRNATSRQNQTNVNSGNNNNNNNN